MNESLDRKEGDTKGGEGTAEQFVERLRTALRKDGDFPASAKVVSELKELTSHPDTTANQITEVILREPSLGTRVLHLVNSSFYRRARPIMTVSQAVVQIGMRPLAELCAGLVLLQKFIPAARKGGVFADCLQKTITTSLLTSMLSAQIKDDKKEKSSGAALKDEEGYLAGTFFELGSLLLAFYFPKVFESAVKRAETKGVSLARGIQEITGLTPTEMSREVIEELRLPDFYADVIEASEPGKRDQVHLRSDHASMASALHAGSTISAAIVDDGTKEGLERALAEVQSSIGIDSALVSDVMGQLNEVFKEQCAMLELRLQELPSHVRKFSTAPEMEGPSEKGPENTQQADLFSSFVEEIRTAVDNREPTASIITSVMETCAFSLRFDRVLLLLISHGRKNLVGRMLLGHIDGFDPSSFERSLGSEAEIHAPDANAVREARPIFQGDPVFEDGWPFVAIPIGFQKRCIGVVYAERVNATEEELTSQEQAAIGVLSELLDRSITVNR